MAMRSSVLPTWAFFIINPSVMKIVDEKAKLPMFGSIGSLNVSVACGAFLYEAVRQRN